MAASSDAGDDKVCNSPSEWTLRRRGKYNNGVERQCVEVLKKRHMTICSFLRKTLLSGILVTVHLHTHFKLHHANQARLRPVRLLENPLVNCKTVAVI